MKAVFFINDVAMALGFRACNEIFAFFQVVWAAGAQLRVYENTSRVVYGSLPLRYRAPDALTHLIRKECAVMSRAVAACEEL